MKQFLKFFFFFLLLTVGLFFYLQPQPTPVSAQSAPSNTEWYMAGANPQRTSWVSEEVRGKLTGEWFRPFEAYIPKKVQPILADNKAFISTSNGLYAIDAETGNQVWVYPTELPLGHSPTYYNGRLYVGGFDHKIHAIDATTGQGIWTFTAKKGFSTNPLVVELNQKVMIYAGCRDGYMYALSDQGSSANLEWSYQTQGPILFSAAYDPSTSSGPVVYFASSDIHAYALNAVNGSLIWSKKLASAGFQSYWPVVYHDYVIFSGVPAYRDIQSAPAGNYDLLNRQVIDIFPTRADYDGMLLAPVGSEAGNWVAGTPTMDVSQSQYGFVPITQYLQEKPQRQAIFVLDQQTGNTAASPPYLWHGTHGMASRYPMIVGSDEVLYDFNVFWSNQYIPWGGLTGWKFNTPYISLIQSGKQAQDEPYAFSSGGNVIYWTMKEYIGAGALDISIPNSGFPSTNSTREWTYYRYDHYWDGEWMATFHPDWKIADVNYDERMNPNAVYGHHGIANSPPIPYKGRVYIRAANALWAFSDNQGAGSAVLLPFSEIQAVESSVEVSETQLKQQLAEEVQKIIDAGHLLPGYISSGIFDMWASRFYGIWLSDYWSNPGETIYTLIQALPYLPASMQDEVKTYIQNEFNSFPIYKYCHTGWATGSMRHHYDLPPEAEEDRYDFGPTNMGSWDLMWEEYSFSIENFYTLWKYAQVLNYSQQQAQQLFDTASASTTPIMRHFTTQPTREFLAKYPHAANAYIAGYIGYLELQKMAGYQESSQIKSLLDDLLNWRVENFSYDMSFVDTSNSASRFYQHMALGRNFMYLVPELSNYLHDNALLKVSETVDVFSGSSPYWFVARAEEGVGEGTIRPLYDYYGLFQAKARILKSSREELVKYLDVPAAATGDLYYIQNLVAVIQAEPEGPEPSTSPSPSTTPGCQSDINGDGTVNLGDIVAVLGSWGQSGGVGDLNGDGTVNLGDIVYILSNWGLAC